MGEQLQKRRDWLAIAAFVVGFFTLIATLCNIKAQLDVVDTQLKQQAKIASAQYVLDLSNKLDSSKYAAIINVIENNPHDYSLLKNGFTPNQVVDYMGIFDTVGDLVLDDVISYRMAYDEFSYDTEKTYCSQDVQDEIKADRQESGVSAGTDAFWSGFQDLATSFLKQDGYTCTSTVLDNQ